jgi:CheY-like chemotaxis protein
MEGGPLILVVDDDPDTLEVARLVLEDEGYQIEVAANGLAALERLRSPERPPVLLLLDLMMPGVDGVTVLRELERSAELPRIPVVIMTAATATAETSALPYPLLRKPFTVDELIRVVSQYCPRLWDEEEASTEVSTSRVDRTSEPVERAPRRPLR